MDVSDAKARGADPGLARFQAANDDDITTADRQRKTLLLAWAVITGAGQPGRAWGRYLSMRAAHFEAAKLRSLGVEARVEGASVTNATTPSSELIAVVAENRRRRIPIVVGWFANSGQARRIVKALRCLGVDATSGTFADIEAAARKVGIALSDLEPR